MSVWFKNLRTGVEWEISDGDLIKRLDESREFSRITRETAKPEDDAPIEPEAPPEDVAEAPKTPARRGKTTK